MEHILLDQNKELQRSPIRSCSGEEFINKYCEGEDRKDYEVAIVNIFDYAKNKGARRIFVGGSFITSQPNPNDFDCVIVFNREGDIPNYIDTSIIGNIEFDILYASEDNPQIIDSYIDLFQTYKMGCLGSPL